jgi:hypothetical protein
VKIRKVLALGSSCAGDARLIADRCDLKTVYRATRWVMGG